MQLDYLDITATRYRSRFLFYKNDTIIGRSLKLYGEYQQVECDFILSFLDRSRVVYDIGANIGYHASAFASCAGQTYCFEANPEHYKLLKMNLQGDRFCQFHNFAVGDREGEILVETFDPTQQSNYGAVKVDSAQGIPVKCRTLDSLTDLPPPDFIKIDVEGHELSVLKGGINLLINRRPLVYFEAQETTDLPQIYSLLKELDYVMTWIIVRNYNPNNLNNNLDNVFGNSAIFSIFAYQPGVMETCPLPVLGPDDHWQRFCS